MIVARGNVDTYVIDTHALVWYLEGSHKLSPVAKQTLDEIERENNLGIVPSIVLAEIVHLSDHRKISLSAEAVISRLQQASNFSIMPLDLAIIMLMIPLKGFELHDRVIMATSTYFNAPLITKDEQIHRSGLRCIW